MDDMMQMYRMANGDEAEMPSMLDLTLLLNTDAPLIAKIADMAANDNEKAEMLAAYVYRLSLLSHRKLTPTEMQEFLTESYRLVDELAK